jgi:hypothetical protein
MSNGPEPVIKWRSDGKWRGQVSGRPYNDTTEKGGETWGVGQGEDPDFDFGKKKGKK